MTEYRLGQTLVNAIGWPAIVIGISPAPRICLAVFGYELDMGDVWRHEYEPCDEAQARALAIGLGHSVTRFDQLLKDYKKKEEKKQAAKAKRLAGKAAK